MWRDCAACGECLHADEYSNNQWYKGEGSSRCSDCVSNDLRSHQDWRLHHNHDRACTGCRRVQSSDNFSSNQWRKGLGLSRCKECVEEGVLHDDNQFGTARRNDALRAEFGRTIDARGSFRDVYFGTYTGGRRTGQPCVKKVFRDVHPAMAQSFFDQDEKVNQKAFEIVSQWNNRDCVDKVFQINIPETWGQGAGRYLVEPFIKNFQKFNSNSGWVCDGDDQWNHALQALSHFSYHALGGQLVFCDLQVNTATQTRLIITIIIIIIILLISISSNKPPYNPSPTYRLNPFATLKQQASHNMKSHNRC